MGFLRGMGKFLGSIIFTTLLVVAVLLMEIVDFTSYDNFKSLAGGIFEKQLFSAISEQELEDLHSALLFQCSQTDRVSVPIFGGQPIVLKCGDIRNSDTSQLPTLITTSLVESLYYKDFDCSFVDCITSGNPQNLLVVASDEGNRFYKSLQVYAWAGTGLGLILLLVSIGTWAGRLKGIGFNLAFTGLPFLFLGYLQSSLIPTLPPEIESSVKPVVDSLTSSLRDKFIIVLVVGIVLLVAGYGLGLYLSRKGGKK